MKNLVTFAKGGNEKKFTISGSKSSTSLKHTRSVSCSSKVDPFIDDIGVSLQAFCFDYTEFKPGAKKVVHDCNSNNVSVISTQEEGKPKLRRLRSWNKEFTKKLRELEENLPRADDLIESLREQVRQSHIQSTAKQHHKRTQSLSLAVEENHTDEDVFSLSESSDRKTASRRRRISSEFRHRITENFIPTTGRRKISTPAPFRKLSTPGPLRKLSTPSLQRKSSESFSRQPDFIDYGACFSPDEMKTFNQVLDKLTTSIRNTNNTAHRRYSNISDTITHSLKEPAKKYLSTHSLKRRRKSHEFTPKKNGDLESVDGDSSSLDGVDSKSDSGSSTFDVSLTRERLDKTAEELDDLSFSRNIWYYGEFDISYSNNTVDEQEDIVLARTGTIIARTDNYGDVVYSLAYTIGDELIPSSFPCLNNRYCLDFTDPTQPRFTSVKFLIAFLIQQNFMERVTFSWLISNCQTFC